MIKKEMSVGEVGPENTPKHQCPRTTGNGNTRRQRERERERRVEGVEVGANRDSNTRHFKHIGVRDNFRYQPPCGK